MKIKFEKTDKLQTQFERHSRNEKQTVTSLREVSLRLWQASMSLETGGPSFQSKEINKTARGSFSSSDHLD